MYPPKGNDAERTVDSGTHDEDDGEDDDDNDDDDDDDGGGSGDHEVNLDMVDADSISIDDSGYVSARPSVVVSPPVVSSTIRGTYKLTNYNIIIIHGLVILQAIQLKLPLADNFRKLTAGRNFTQDICTSVCSIHNKLRHLLRELLKDISITFCFR